MRCVREVMAVYGLCVCLCGCGGAETKDDPAPTAEPAAAGKAGPATPEPTAEAGAPAGLAEVAGKLVAALEARGRKRVAMAGISTVEGKETKLGKYLTDKLLTRLVEQGPSLSFIERSALKKVVLEQKFTHSGLADPATTAELGRLIGAEALVLGTVTVLAESVDVNVRAVDAQTAAILGTADTELPRTGSLAGNIDPDAAVAQAPALTLTTTLLGERENSSGGYDQVVVTEGSTLKSGDGLKIAFQTNREAFVYCLLLDSQGKGSVIFPMEGIATSNRVQGGRDVVIPPGEDWFFLDQNTGTETIYVLASLGSMPEIDTLVAKLEQMGPTRDHKLADQEVAAFAYQGACGSTRGIGGVKKGGGCKPAVGATRGIGGVKKSRPVKFKLTGGKEIEQQKEMLTGAGAVVRVVTFQHR